MPAKAWRSGLAGLVAVWKHHGRPIVHVNGRRGNAIAMVARLVVPGFRYVTTVHGVLGLHDRRNVIYRLVDLAAGRFATAVIAVSADTRRRLLKAGTPDSRIVVVPNGLAATELAALRAVAARREPGDAWMDAHGRPLRVGFLGRLSPEKGTRELIEACQHLHGSGASVTVVIAGDGPDLEWMVRASGPMVEDGFLRFVGEVRDVPAFLGDVDVLVMPSHNEGMPYVLLEAMAAGCAVVAFDVGGIGEVIQTDSLGILVPPRDVEGLVTGLRCLVDERSRAAAIGRAASAAMEGEYALDRRLPRLAQAYGVGLEQIRASGHGPEGVRAD
jgi:glycosyltransferase involved in cell wall biosynthesis